MTAFIVSFNDDEEGFEILEDEEVNEESVEPEAEEEVIWETTED